MSLNPTGRVGSILFQHIFVLNFPFITAFFPSCRLVRRSAQENDMSKSCFIVTPIGGEDTDMRRATDGLIKAVIRPVLKDLGYTATASHEMSSPGSITRQVH